MPYFSVVIPLYNKRNYITATLNSVLGQTFTDFEIIVVDDASTDDSLAIAQQIEDSRIHFVSHEKNKGLSASRNTGIRNAQAEYIAFLDADDIWQPQFLETIHGLIQKYPEAGLFSTKYDEQHPGNVVIQHHFPIKNGIVTDFFEKERRQHIYCYSSLCIKKNVFDLAGYFDESITMGEDVDFNVRANLEYQLAYDNVAMARIIMNSENQITHSSMKDKIIIDHDKYERENPGNQPLKKYLDFHRYTMAKRYKMAGDDATAKKLIIAIDTSNLNWKQRLLLAAPAFILRHIKAIKKTLAKKGLNPTTY
ncbi:glycosyltransferase family 2 protein [Flavobacterium sp.]|uniref:glycosyltransferase family 2 protein n=1 Tax=Flavobacterium sp. TaxID=239 RepID=UPI0040333796